MLWAGILGGLSCVIKAFLGALFFIPLIIMVNDSTNIYIKQPSYLDSVFFLMLLSAFIDLFLKPEKPNKE